MWWVDKIAKEILLAEEKARIEADILVERILEKVKSPEVAAKPVSVPIIVERTVTVDEKNYRVDNIYEVYNISRDVLPSLVSGRIDVFYLISPSDQFRVIVYCDDEKKYDDNYSSLEDKSMPDPKLTALSRDNKYVVAITDISFERSVYIAIKVFQTIVFEQIHADVLLRKKLVE